MSPQTVSARVTLCQVFENKSDEPTTRAKYVFPIPAQAAVCAFEMCTEDGRTITGVVKEKMKAAAIHENAIKQGRMTGLVEWATDDGGVHSIPNFWPFLTMFLSFYDISWLPSRSTKGYNKDYCRWKSVRTLIFS